VDGIRITTWQYDSYLVEWLDRFGIEYQADAACETIDVFTTNGIPEALAHGGYKLVRGVLLDYDPASYD